MKSKIKNKIKAPLFKKVTRINLEKKIRLQTVKLKSQRGRLRQGASREKLGSNREKLADVKARQQTDKLKIRDGQLRQGANREKLGFNREKLAEVKARQQTDKLKIRDGQLRQGADREKQGANREKLWADREKEGADREKIAEEEIHIRTKAMESTFDGIFIIDAIKPDFPIIFANQSFYNLTGYSRSEVIGKNYFLLYGYNDNSRIYEEIKQTLLQGKSFHGEMLNFKKNGDKFWSLLRITLVRDKFGVITHYVGNKTDTTLMRQRDFEIKEQREELLHVTRVGKLAEFVSSLAHEISQPLTAILSYAQAAQRLLKEREPQTQEILQFIINDDQRASEVIRRLRYLLKKTKPAFEPLDINVLINDTISLIMPDITARDKAIKLELFTNPPSIQGDRIQLQQVLLNLISNSLEAMESSKDAHELKIRTSLKDKYTVLVEVMDSGCGIPEGNMKKLFTHFFTSKRDGLGMGLSISRSIVEAHGGHLEAENNHELGATFYFTIPIYLKND